MAQRIQSQRSFQTQLKIGRIRSQLALSFQMAEVTIPRQLFASILRLIAELRPPPDSSPA